MNAEQTICARIAELQAELLDQQERLVVLLDLGALTCRCPLGEEHVVVIYAYDTHEDDAVLESVVIGGDCVPVQNFSESRVSSWRMHCLRDWDRRMQQSMRRAA